MTQASLIKRGFSLLELVVATFVGAILAGAVITVMVGQLQLNSSHNRNMANQQNMRDSVNYMLEEISLCGSNVSEPFITTATSTALTFIGDINGDGNWDEVSYSYEGSNLMRSLRTSPDQGSNWNEVSTDTLLENVSMFSFSYFAEGNLATDQESEIHSIGIAVALGNDDTATAFTSGRTREYSMTGRITLRNRKI